LGQYYYRSSIEYLALLFFSSEILYFLCTGLISITSVMDRLEHKTFSVVVCALKIRELILFSLEKIDHIYLTGMPVWRRNWWAAVTARSVCVEFVVTTMITCAGWLEL